MRKSIHSYVLALSCGENRFQNPFTTGGEFVYATNSFVCVRVPKKYVTGDLKQEELRVEDVFESKAMELRTLRINTNALLCDLAQYGLFLDVNRKCNECHGTGEAECFHCGNDSECEDCSGKGFKGGKGDPIKSIRFKKSMIVLDGYTFTADYLHILALTALALGVADFDLQMDGQKGIAHFGDVSFVIMGCVTK